jgi:hypothetical protein
VLNVVGKNGSTVATAASTEFWLTLPPPAFPSCLDGPTTDTRTAKLKRPALSAMNSTVAVVPFWTF